ncbi:MAG: phage tail tape measure protein, partial [Nanoarchaeota archaeon]|nr:phage tail tape measure protein [Nanoarchaeota archaeon]
LLEPFKKAKENFETFSDTMGAVNAVTNATAREFDALTQQALLMGATTRFTAEQAAEGLKALAKAGFTAQEQIATLPAVMRLAQAAATELATAAQIATVVMNEFQMDPEQFIQASDAIALAANRTLASVEDLGFSFKYVGALAAN